MEARMNHIEVKILNPEVIDNCERMMVTAARLTQRGHSIHNMGDFIDLYNKSFSMDTVTNMANLPHPTIQKFGLINVVIVGASRRFLAQITRHQNEVKFMSASCQYSDYSQEADFVVPYELIDKPEQVNEYISICLNEKAEYERLVASGIDHDTAAYMLPQALRNVLIISATPYQWKHMISQRICRRNTTEMRYVMLKIWGLLYSYSPALFGTGCGPFCMQGKCQEGKMSCGNIMAGNPYEILRKDFCKIYED